MLFEKISWILLLLFDILILMAIISIVKINKIKRFPDKFSPLFYTLFFMLIIWFLIKYSPW